MVSHLLLTPFLFPLSLLLSTCYSQVVLWVPPTVGRSPTHKSLCDLRQVTPLLGYFSFLVCKVKDTPLWWLKRLIHTKVLGWHLPHEVLALYLRFHASLLCCTLQTQVSFQPDCQRTSPKERNWINDFTSLREGWEPGRTHPSQQKLCFRKDTWRA